MSDNDKPQGGTAQERRVPRQVEEARQAHEDALNLLEDQEKKIAELPDETTDEERKLHEGVYNEIKARVERMRKQLERTIDLAKARAATPDPEAELAEQRGQPAGHLQVQEPMVYERGGPHSFFRDLVASHEGADSEAVERLGLHKRQMVVEKRDVTTGSPGAGGFVPPVYLGEQYIDVAMAGRPFADACTSIPLDPQGKTMTIPRVQVAPAVAVQASEAAAVTETDFDDELYTVDKVTIAGQNDVSIQAYDWTSPGLEEVIMRDLVRDYARKLDTQLISGSGSSGQHRGIRNVSGINSVAFAAGGADDLLGKVFEAAAAIDTNSPGFEGNTVLMHGRRAFWMASHRDANNNLLAVGAFEVSAGAQANASARQVADLRVIRDNNIATNLGTNTRDDEVFVLDPAECYLAEGPLRARTMSEVLSGTLQVRIQLYAYSAFFGGRRPAVITQISGAGLTTPVFPST